MYVIECKIDSTARIALEQIRSKEYALPWAVDGREKILIGLNFSTKTRRPEEWVIATESDTQGDTQDDTQGNALDMWIEEQIRTNPKITTEELARTSKKGLATIKRHIAKLTHIKYVGSGYSGHWEIVENDAEA